MPTPQTMNLALWQCPYAGSVTEALSCLDRAARQARMQGADLLVCPEMSLTGYAIGTDAIRALAEPPDGAMAQAVGDLARRHGLAIVFGYPEQRPDGHRPFNAVQMVDADGAPVARYAKTHLFGAMDRAQFSPGAEAPRVFPWRGWHVGLLICYDVEFPETVRVLGLQGADLVLVPTANMRAFDEVPRVLVPARACENRLWVAYANACGRDAAFEYGGLSTLADPGGIIRVQSGREEDLPVFTLDPPAVRNGPEQPPWSHRRPDLYQWLTQPPQRR